MSQAAFSAMCKEAHAGNLPGNASRADVRNAAEAVSMEATPFGPIIQTIQVIGTRGQIVEIEIQHPFAAIYAAARRKHYSALLVRTHAREPSSPAHPWGLCIYSDEVCPGNRLSADPSRLIQSIYYSFLNFGAAALSKEDFWMVACTLRSAIVRLIEAGMSQLIATILLVFFSHNSHNMRHGGLLVQLASGDHIRIFAALFLMLADESALHSTWLCKGAGGTKLCICCKNIMDPSHIVRHGFPPDGYFKAFNLVYKYGDLDLMTKADVFEIIDELRDTYVGPGDGAFALREQILGFSHNRLSLLANPHLREFLDPPCQNAFDPGHCILSGAFPKEMDLLMSELRKFHLDYEQLGEYVQLWTWPRRIEAKSVTGKEAFGDRRARSNRSAHSMKCSQTEALSLYAVIRVWLIEVVGPIAELAAPLYSFMCLCDLIDIIFLSARGLNTADELAAAVTEYLESYAAAYGPDAMIPKHHFLLHLFTVMLLLGWLPNCLVLERKHKSVKKWADPMRNTTSIDHSVLRDVTNDAFHNLEHADFLILDEGLVNPKAPPRKVLQWLTDTFGADGTPFYYSLTARYNAYETCSNGDIVAVRDADNGWLAWRVWFHASANGVAFTTAAELELVSRSDSGRTSEWRDTGRSDVVELDSILCVFIFADADDIITLIHPFTLRD